MLDIQSISVKMGKDRTHVATTTGDNYPEFEVADLIDMLKRYGLNARMCGRTIGDEPSLGIFNRDIMDFYTSDGHYQGPYCELKVLVAIPKGA